MMIDQSFVLQWCCAYFRLPPFIFSSADVLPPLSARKCCQSIKKQKTFHYGTFLRFWRFSMKRQLGGVKDGR
jgi:hypothetical protein